MGYHKPALLHESIEGLNIRPEGIYVDLTFGGGGHSLEVLKKLGKKGRLVAFDQDQDARANVPDDSRIIFVGANFRYLRNFLRYHAIEKVDGILADLGISSHQIDIPGRGFSFKSEAALDMRMDVRSKLTASSLLNEYPVNELARIFWTYGELGNGRALATAIGNARRQGELRTTGELEEALKRFIPRAKPSKFLAKVYQALRIEVNGEMESLGEMLLQTTGSLQDGGRLVVITYHSIEDRIVKNFMRSGNLEGELAKDFYGHPQTPWKLVNRSVITPSDEELEVNNRARSAKLRIAERVN
ncbi:MAG: 16S rRNA (cytosine(1402)-N(4))-methyltransferase RsmH [Bacteroidota bacterium]